MYPVSSALTIITLHQRCFKVVILLSMRTYKISTPWPTVVMFLYLVLINAGHAVMPGVTGGNNPHNWSDLDTDSEAEEAQKKNFFDSLNW